MKWNLRSIQPQQFFSRIQLLQSYLSSLAEHLLIRLVPAQTINHFQISKTSNYNIREGKKYKFDNKKGYSFIHHKWIQMNQT